MGDGRKWSYWREGQTLLLAGFRGRKHVATVDGNYYNLQIKEPGKYRTKVVWQSSHDGREIEISSGESIINIRRRKVEAESISQSGQSIKKDSGNLDIAGTYFPKHKTLLKRPRSGEVLLSWAVKECRCDSYQVEYTFLDKTRSIRSSLPFVSLPVENSGDFYWKVKFFNKK